MEHVSDVEWGRSCVVLPGASSRSSESLQIVLILLQHVHRLLFVFQYSITLFSQVFFFHLIYVFCAQMFFSDHKNKHWKNFIVDSYIVYIFLYTFSLYSYIFLWSELEAVSNRKLKTWNKVELEQNDHRMLWRGKMDFVQSHGRARE